MPSLTYGHIVQYAYDSNDKLAAKSLFYHGKWELVDIYHNRFRVKAKHKETE